MANIKTITVDFDSLEECKSLMNQIRSQIGQLSLAKDGFISKNERVKKVFDACYKIYSTDISEIYKDQTLDENRIYYVYAHGDPGFKIAVKKEGKSTFAATLGLENMPFYIGKGTGNRAFELDRNDSHRKIRQRLKTFNQEISVKIINDNLTAKEALMYESKLIDIFGLKSFGGRLVNLDEGINSKERRKLYANELNELSSFYRNSMKIEV